MDRYPVDNSLFSGDNSGALGITGTLSQQRPQHYPIHTARLDRG
jgi:hypothetical protein